MDGTRGQIAWDGFVADVFYPRNACRHPIRVKEWLVMDSYQFVKEKRLIKYVHKRFGDMRARSMLFMLVPGNQ